MTILDHEAQAAPAAQTDQVLPEGYLTPTESNIVGYLLGRRQDAEHIARGLGQDAQAINVLCQRMYLRGLLSMTELQGQTLYSVR